MASPKSAPLLRRVKSWQLVALGISGWITLYSVAVISWGSGSNLIGNAQGGCFAVTMTLAGLEARRFKSAGAVPPNPLQWAEAVTTQQLDQTLAHVIKKDEYRIELVRAIESERGFGVRAVKGGRTLVFETSRWKEPVIDLSHAETTEANRKMVRADLAVIVGAGMANPDAEAFTQTHPVRLLIGWKLKDFVAGEIPAADNQPGVNTEPSSSEKSV